MINAAPHTPIESHPDYAPLMQIVALDADCRVYACDDAIAASRWVAGLLSLIVQNADRL